MINDVNYITLWHLHSPELTFRVVILMKSNTLCWTFSILVLWVLSDLYVCLIVPHRKELSEELNNLNTKLHKDGKNIKKD